jgi:hypothetical protein
MDVGHPLTPSNGGGTANAQPTPVQDASKNTGTRKARKVQRAPL